MVASDATEMYGIYTHYGGSRSNGSPGSANGILAADASRSTGILSSKGSRCSPDGSRSTGILSSSSSRPTGTPSSDSSRSAGILSSKASQSSPDGSRSTGILSSSSSRPTGILSPDGSLSTGCSDGIPSSDDNHSSDSSISSAGRRSADAHKSGIPTKDYRLKNSRSTFCRTNYNHYANARFLQSPPASSIPNWLPTTRHSNPEHQTSETDDRQGPKTDRQEPESDRLPLPVSSLPAWLPSPGNPQQPPALPTSCFSPMPANWPSCSAIEQLLLRKTSLRGKVTSNT